MKLPLLALRSIITAAIVLLLTLGTLPAAVAATPGITASVLLNGETYNGTDVVNEGAELTLRVQYNTNVVPGSTVVFDLGSNVAVSGVPTANSAIESVTQDGNKVSIKFKDPWPPGVNQGVFDLKFKVNSVEHSSNDKITWTINGEENSVDVIVRDSGDEFANVTEVFGKSVTPNNLDSLVTVVGGEVKLKTPDVNNQELTYSLQVDSPVARNNFAITDQLPAGLSYVAGSFAGQLTTWDADGLNETTDPFSFAPTVTSSAFNGAVDVPGPSKLKITYKAKVTDVAAVEALLQAQYDALGGAPGTFKTNLTNTATFGGAGTSRTASVRLQHTVADPNPGPNLGSTFAKSAGWSTKNVNTDEDGNLTPAADIVYTLKADLRGWDGTNPNKVLGQNVVISDALPMQANWNTGAADFITATGLTLTAAASCPADAATFAGDAFVGKYCVDGQRLLVNVGKDTTTNATIAVKAQLNTVSGLTQTGSTTIKDATPYRWRNVADFNYRAGNPYSVTRDVTVVVLPDSTNGINDSSVFTKTGAAVDSTIAPGESAVVNYTFKVTAGKGIDARTSKIVDYVDTGVFDLSDLNAVGILGTYNGVALNENHFDLSVDGAGNLVIELSPAGKTIVLNQGVDKAYEVKISLTTKPFDGKQTKEIKNKATLFGESDNPLYWSETETSATSYGDEAEVRKRLWDRTGEEWTESLNAKMDGAGHLVQDTYVYRIEFIPHGSYNQVVIVPVEDLLPSAVDFLGFVDEADAATGANPAGGPVDIGGNLIASYDAGSKTVTISQKSGTKLAAGSPIAAYVAVKVNDASAPIVNSIGSTSAKIIPLPSVSVGDYVWNDVNRDGVQDATDVPLKDVVLTLTGPDGESVTDVDGNPVGTTSTDADGKYSFDNLPVLPAGQSYTVTVTNPDGFVSTKTDEGTTATDSSTGSATSGDLTEDGARDPKLDFGFVTKSYALGDYVWIDVNKNGIQDTGEKSLPGVGVEISEADGGSVTDVYGDAVHPTMTDMNGRYVFDNLPAGTYLIRFTLTKKQKKMYEFTRRDLGSSDHLDSDANPSDGLTVTVVLDDSNAALTGDYEFADIGATQGIDPTWDAGVIVKRNAVPGDSEHDGSGGILPNTGTNIGPGLTGAMIMLLGLGGVFLRLGRRRAL